MALAKKIKRLARLLLPTRTLELAAEMRPKKEANQRKFSNPGGCPNWRKFSKQLARVFILVPPQSFFSIPTGASFQTRAPQPTSASFQTRAAQSFLLSFCVVNKFYCLGATLRPSQEMERAEGRVFCLYLFSACFGQAQKRIPLQPLAQ